MAYDRTGRKQEKSRVYVRVCSEMDRTGYLQPRSILWKNGKAFPIEEIRDFRPAESAAGRDLPCGDCYTVVIGGQERLLYFEHADPRTAGRAGRWFLESGGSRTGREA